jgi:chromate transport protein ChrA
MMKMFEKIKQFFKNYNNILNSFTIAILCICFYFSNSIYVDLVLIFICLYFFFIEYKQRS